MAKELVDCLGRRRSPATTSAFHVGRRPRNRGMRYPADPPPVQEIIAVMRAAGAGAYGDRLRGVMVVCWRAGLRVGEALAPAETDLDPSQGAILIRKGKGGKRREVGIDRFGWKHPDPWLERRRQLPVGALLCVLHGPSRGRPWSPAAVCSELRRAAAKAGVRRRLAPDQLRHAHAVEMAHEGVPMVVIQRQLGHAHLGITAIYLHGIDNAEIIDTVHRRAAPVIPASSRLRSPLAL
jgi:site-specific recombinase XerD